MQRQRDRGGGTVRRSTPLTVLAIAGIACVLAAGAVGATGIDGAIQEQYEPDNDELSTAPEIEPGVYTGLEHPERDDDYYAVEVDAGERLSVNISFDSGDLDLVVYDDGISDRVAESRQISGSTERVVVDADEADTYYVLVSGYDADAVYDMGISVETLPTPDQYEPNDDERSAAAIEPGMHEELTVIDGDNDVFSFEAAAGEEIAAAASFVHARGDLDLSLYSPNGTLLEESNSRTDGELVTATASQSGTFQLFVWGLSGATTTYDLELRTGADAIGRVTGDDSGSSGRSGGDTGGSDGESGDGASTAGGSGGAASGGSGTDTAGGSGDGSEGESSSSSGGMPGFGPILAAIGLVGGILLAATRRDDH